MPNFQDLPDELVLKVLSYMETKDIVSCGQLSKRIRQISHDGTLWVTANLEKKIVKTELLEMILSKGCKILNLSNSTIIGSLSSNLKSQLRVLNFSRLVGAWPAQECCIENIDILEELLFSCHSLQHLVMEGILLTPKMAVGICKNSKTLQILNLNPAFINEKKNSFLDDSYYLTCLQKIFKGRQELKEVNSIDYCQDLKEVNSIDTVSSFIELKSTFKNLNLYSKASFYAIIMSWKNVA